MASLKKEFVVVDNHSDEVLSSKGYGTEREAVEANSYAHPQQIETAELISVDVAAGYAEVMRYSPERGYFPDTLPAYWLCQRHRLVAAAFAAEEAAAWAGCPRNYLAF